MRPILRSCPVQVGLAAVVLGMGAVGFVPLFGGPGYESALGAGLVLPFAVAIAAGLELSSSRGMQPIDGLSRGLAVGGLLALAAWLTMLGHGLRVGFCDVLAGTAHVFLGPGVGALLAGAWGAVAGELSSRCRRRRLVAVLLSLAAPLVSILVSVFRFLTSPMIFAYDPFVGYFSGTFYDTVIDASGLVSYRAGSAATLLAAVALAWHFTRDAQGRLVRMRVRPMVTIGGLLAAVASLAANLLGDRLGHWQTSATIAAALGARTSGQRCDVVHARTLRPADMARFTADCDAHIAAAERWWEASGPHRITAYVFESAAQKGALMGAADTYIAKPWRREIYVQAAAYPHPVLGHELIHAVASAFAPGPLHVAGNLGGLLPDPGLIEGVAVAAEPPEGDLTPREWAKAMKDLHLLPPLGRLFALGFLGQNTGVAYTVSGAFVGWIHDRWGASAVRAWYGGRLLSDVTGMSWSALEHAWHEDLDRVALPEAARAQAKARFDRPAIFGRRCPHVVDACKGRADRLRGIGDYEGARAALDQVLALDPHDDSTRIAMAGVLLRDGKVQEGTRALEAIAEGTGVAQRVRDRAIEELGDRALAAGHGDQAARQYAAVMARTVDEDHLRTLDVKTAAGLDERFRASVVALLVGTPTRGPDRSLAMELLGRLSRDAPDEGLAFYLLGRQYMNSAQYEEAAERLDRALAASPRIPRVRVEAERLRLVAACAIGDVTAARDFFTRYAGHPEVSTARRDGARALVERCTAPYGHAGDHEQGQ